MQSNAAALEPFSTFFPEYLRTGRLSKNNQDSLNIEWNRIRTAADPYKQILYNIVGRFDVRLLGFLDC